MSALRFVKGQKVKMHLVHQGFNYQIDKKTDKKTYYRCSYGQTDYPCPGRLHVSNEVVVFDNNNHNHASNIARIDGREIMELIKQKARETCDTPSQILTSIDVSFLKFISK